MTDGKKTIPETIPILPIFQFEKVAPRSVWSNLVVTFGVFQVISKKSKQFSRFWLIDFIFMSSIFRLQTKCWVFSTSNGSVKYSSSSIWNVLFFPLVYVVDTKKRGPLLLSTLMVLNSETVFVLCLSSFTSTSSLTWSPTPLLFPCLLLQTLSR